MPALSKKQQKFMGIVRSIQKGEQPASKFDKDARDAAKDMKKSSVKKFASTKHKGLPMKKEVLGKLKELIKQELSEYTYGVGDVVKDDNPTCPHYGAQGKVKSVNPKSVVFVVMNKGDNFEPGQELEKSHDQMKKIGESINEADARNDKSIGTKNYKGVGWFWPSDSWKHYLRDTSDKGRKVVHDLWLKAGFEIKKNNRGIPGFDIKSNERNKAMKIVDMINKRIPIKESVNETKFYAFYNNKRHQINGKDAYDAKLQAIKKLKVPKSKVGVLAIMSVKAYDNQQFRFESINEGGVEKVLKMANDQSFGKLGGRTVDALSAGLFKGVYDKASDKNKEKINKMNEKQLYVFMTKLWSKFGNQVRIG